MDFQQPHRYMRAPPPPPPPPPSMADPHSYQAPPPPPPQPPSQLPGPWFSGQFPYHHPSQQSPSNHQQWAPPPPSDHLPPPPYQPLPYPAQPLHNHQYPPRPHVPPPHPQSHIMPQSYPQVNQDWGNPNWGHHQGWEYPAHNQEEDWAAKAREWAAAKVATDNPQSQFTPVVRQEEQNHYHDQYLQNVDTNYSDVQQSSVTASSYPQYPPLAAPPHRTPVGHLQEPASFSSGYVRDGYLPYSGRDGTLAGDSNAAYPQQESSATSLSVHKQEVPSSYSSIADKEEAADQNEKFYNSLPFPIVSTPQHHVQPPLHAIGRSVLMEHPHYVFGNHSAEPTTDRSDQPLDFVHRFSRDRDSHVQPNYSHDSVGPVRGIESVAAVPSIHAWAPPAPPGVVYPPVRPSRPQVDPAVAVPSPVSGHSAPIFGRMPGPSFQPTIQSVTAPFGIGTGTVLHPTTAFLGDAYGGSGISERPKKASVPNWLREEIIKNKAGIASSDPELSKEESKSIEDEGVDKSTGKGDQAESKSIDSSRSTEGEDDDEDVEAARTAAVNKEIKRVLTEVLLKVTDELFDEIATKVLSEDDLTVEVDDNDAASNHKVSPSTPAVQTPKASAKVLIPAKVKETDSDDVSKKSTSSSPGDVLGLGSYASDEDEDGAIESSGVPNSRASSVHQQPITKMLLEVADNGSSQEGTEEHSKTNIEVRISPGRRSPNGAPVNHIAAVGELSDNRASREESVHGELRARYSSKTESEAVGDETNIDIEKMLDGSVVSKSKDSVGKKVVLRTELPVENFSAKKSTLDGSQGRKTINKPDKNDRHDSKRDSAVKDFVKEVESGKDRTYGKGDENRRRQDERHVWKERTDDRNGSKEKTKEQGFKSREKTKDSDSRKRLAHPDVKEDRKETERDRRASAKEDNGRKRERTKDVKGDRSKHKLASDSSRHKRHRSSSGGSRERNSKDKLVVSHANDSSDESSDDSKRKVHSKRRNLSPSPVRPRRQVSRSPHSKHSQRRHSPYSSLETSRGRRSRSRSPVRRQR